MSNRQTFKEKEGGKQPQPAPQPDKQSDTTTEPKK